LARAIYENSSYAGLTRVSINLQESVTKKMDGRVKPGHDDLNNLRQTKKPALPPAFS
jgi:hypothetical protein